MINPRSEIVFWTGIMRDHAMFQANTLALFTQKYPLNPL